MEFHFAHPHPLDATLWYWRGDTTRRGNDPKWILDVAWMDGGYEAGKEVEFRREETGPVAEDEAKVWASQFIREVIT